MAVNTYKAQLNYYDHTYGWGNAGTCAQGDGRTWGAGSARTGVMYFPGLSNLKGKIINSIKITVVNRAGGQNAQKTAHFYRSASQGGIKTSLGSGHRTGSQIGTLVGNFHAYAVESLSFTPTFFNSYIAAGEDTFCIYSATSSEYLVWGAVTLEVTWQEPATQPTLSDGTVEMGKTVTISTPAVNSSYTHNIWAAFGEEGIAIAERASTGATWTPSLDLAKQIPSAISGIGTVYCDTFDANGTLLGTKSVGITLTVPSSVVPSAGKLTAAVTEDTSGTGQFVRGMGKAKLTLSGASGVYGSTIKSYTISGGGWSSNKSTLTTGILQAAGEITFTAVVTDSRGRSAQTTGTIKVIAYDKPGISSLSVYRCDASGAKKNAGTYAAIEIKASYSAITGNTVTLKAAYKLTSATSYGSAATLTNNGKTVIGGGTLSASHTYDVRIIVADKFNTTTVTASLRTKNVIWSVLPKGLGFAIGKVAELANWLDVAWHTRIRGNLQVDGTISSADQYRIKWQNIPDGADLNDDTYKVPGHYRSPLASYTIKNKPPGAPYNAFELTVTGIADLSYCTQRFKDIASNREWARTQTNWQTPWTWTSWQEAPHFLGPTDHTLSLNEATKSDTETGIFLKRGRSAGVKSSYIYEADDDRAQLSLRQQTPNGSAAVTLRCTYDGNEGVLHSDISNMNIGASWKYMNCGYFNSLFAGSLGWKTLWHGNLSSGDAVISNAGKYAALLIGGYPGANAYRVVTAVPAGALRAQITTNATYLEFGLAYSGDDATLSIRVNPSSGYIEYIWGLVQYKL